MKLKELWSKAKYQVIDIIKFLIFTITGIMGFWAIYGMIWIANGLPTSNQVMWVLFALAMASEWFFFKWLTR